jgi:prevent-host-death family protein
MHTWKLEDAKNRFSELVRRARAHEPQLVTRNGREAVVVLSVEDYRKLSPPGETLLSFLRGSPLAEAFAAGELELERERDPGRDIDL